MVNKVKQWKSWEDNEASKFIVRILLYNRTDVGRLFENNVIIAEKPFINYHTSKIICNCIIFLFVFVLIDVVRNRKKYFSIVSNEFKNISTK